MARALVTALVIGLLLTVSGCGDADEPSPRKPARTLSDLEKRGVDRLSRAQIERFAKIRIPPEATNLRSFTRSAMDTQLLVSFRLPRERLAAFVRSGDFATKLVADNRAIATPIGAQIGWRLEDAERIEGLADTQPGLGRNLVVVLDDPQRPMVHLEAVTL